MAEALLGKSVRCTGCQQRFVANPDPLKPEESQSGQAPQVPLPPLSAPVRRRHTPLEAEDPRDNQGLPFCPGCGRRVGWDVLRCPYCDEELEPELSYGRPPRSPVLRRDWVPHRGRVVLTLGNISMALGGLALCTAGLAALASIPLGITAWTFAQQDLSQMREGVMDPQGRSDTEAGRTGGILGVVLGVIFAFFYVVVYLGLGH
jgi:hypothetical protein